MKPSRLETICKVTLRLFLFPSLLDMAPPRFLADIDMRSLDWNGAVEPKRIVQEIRIGPVE